MNIYIKEMSEYVRTGLKWPILRFSLKAHQKNIYQEFSSIIIITNFLHKNTYLFNYHAKYFINYFWSRNGIFGELNMIYRNNIDICINLFIYIHILYATGNRLEENNFPNRKNVTSLIFEKNGQPFKLTTIGDKNIIITHINTNIHIFFLIKNYIKTNYNEFLGFFFYFGLLRQNNTQPMCSNKAKSTVVIT